MQTLRQIAQLATSNEFPPSALVAARRRIVIPAGSDMKTEGLFSISAAKDLPYYVGRMPESWVIAQWVMPANQASRPFIEQDAIKDVAALLCFVFQRRIVVADELPATLEGASYTSFIPTPHKVDSRLYAPIPAGPEALWETLRTILSITDETQFVAISNAVRLYHSAAVTAEVDYSAAYLLLVAGMEALAGAFEDAPLTFHEWSHAARWDKWIGDVGLNDDVADRLREMLIRVHGTPLRQRFIALGVQAATDEFWNLPWERAEPLLEMTQSQSSIRGVRLRVEADVTPARIGKQKLRSILARIYDARSALVHAGQPFPPLTSLDLPQEVEFRYASSSGKKEKVRLPSFSWFERLVWFAIDYCTRLAKKDETYTLPDVRVQPAEF